MDKQKLIDETIERFKGRFPINAEKLITPADKWSGPDSCLGFVTADAGHIVKGDNAWQVLCSKDEFNHRAKEIGWVNGYLWGKEYPTNGKRPDFPDDVKVSAYCGVDGNWLAPRKVSSLLWQHAEAFRIVDERYKPKQPESHSKPSIDNSWYEKGEPPPVGAVCEVYNDIADGHPAWEGCELLFVGKFKVVYNSNSCYERVADVENVKFRPIKTEREKFVEAAVEAIKAKHAAPHAVYENCSIALFESGKFKLITDEKINP